MSRKFNYFDDEPLEPSKPSFYLNNQTQPQKNTQSVKNTKKAKPLEVAKEFVMYGASVIGANTVSAFSKAKRQVEKDKGTKRGKIRATAVGVVSMILCVVIISTSIIISANRVNQRSTKFEAAAYKVSVEYLSKYGKPNYQYMKQKYDVTSYMLTGLSLVREIDFNNDGMSELLLAYNVGDDYYCDVWGFVGKDFVKLYNKKLITPEDKNEGIYLVLYSKGKETYIVEHTTKDPKKVLICSMRTSKFKYKTIVNYDKEANTYKQFGKDVTDDFERIKLMGLGEGIVANMADRVAKTIDGFSTSKDGKINEVDVASINQVYYSIVDQYNRTYDVASLDSRDGYNYINGLAVVDLIDFNNDGTKELVLIYRRTVNERSEDYDGNYISIETYKYYCDIYTFNGKDARRIYTCEGMSNNLDDNDVQYFLTGKKGKKTVLATNMFTTKKYGRIINATSRILEFDGEQFQQQFKASYNTEYGYTDYYIDGDHTYKNSFREKGGYQVPFFNGEESYDTTKWDVIYIQTDSKKKQYLTNQIKKTEDTIKSLDSSYNPDNVKISVDE